MTHHWLNKIRDEDAKRQLFSSGKQLYVGILASDDAVAHVTMSLQNMLFCQVPYLVDISHSILEHLLSIS